MKKINRVGETAVASNGMLMTIIAYRNTNDIDIQFEDGTILYHKQYNSFSRGQIRYESFKDKCKKANISYNTALIYRIDHPELTDEQVIQYYLTPKEQSFADKCKKANINYHTAFEYRRNHPELTDEQVIVYYRPDLYINIFGELVGI